MNTIQNKLYNDLMNLCSLDDSPFYYVDHTLEGADCVFRIFLYRLASYTDFLQDNALEARGTMFTIHDDDIQLVSLPFKKFFNNLENPMTMDLDFSQTAYIQDKMDGSLISTYTWDGCKSFFGLKSKGSLHSDQAKDATEYILKEENCNLWNFLNYMVNTGATVNLEWTAPHNRIVLPYSKGRLTVLGARNNGSTSDINLDYLYNEMLEWHCEEFLCQGIDIGDETPQEFVERIPSMEGIEGYVITLNDGQRVKIKTDWYVSLHRSKDSVNSAKALFECVVNEAHDDLRGIFPDDESLNNRINVMEAKVKNIYNDVTNTVENFYKNNKYLDRKEYAILGQKELSRLYFSVAMSLYIGKDIDYQQWLLKHYKDFGITDDNLTEDV